MKNFIRMLGVVLLMASCSQEASLPEETVPDSSSLPANMLYHGEMVLGRTLENPYSLKNMENSLKDLYGTRAEVTLEPNCRYVRFLPKNDEQFSALADLGVDMFDHPLDRENLRDGDYWHDPSALKGSFMKCWKTASFPMPSHRPRALNMPTGMP